MTQTYRTSLFIAASRDVVFAHFVDPSLLVRWMGDYARLEPRSNGLFSVDINGVLIRGHYVRLEPPHIIEVGWGEAGNAEMPPGSTQLRIELEAVEGGTQLLLEHRGLSASEATKHGIGWPHFLGRLSIRAAGGNPGPDPFAKGASA